VRCQLPSTAYALHLNWVIEYSLLSESIHLNGNTLTSWVKLVFSAAFSWHEIDIMSKQAQWGMNECVWYHQQRRWVLWKDFPRKARTIQFLCFNHHKLNNYRTLLCLRTDVALCHSLITVVTLMTKSKHCDVESFHYNFHRIIVWTFTSLFYISCDRNQIV
jgi:hypothetical protein